MIKYMEGNIFDSSADILVNPVNCRGVMGGGLALEFKHRYPDMYHKYESKCRTGLLKIGQPWLWANIYGGHDVLCFPTKDHWKDPSKLEYIESGMGRIWFYFPPHPLRGSIAFPKLGCGLGGLDWEIVRPLMEKWVSYFLPGVRVEVWI
jgi:O-acetyl-ADP-ribose deacetylase (regulator of RNase III)